MELGGAIGNDQCSTDHLGLAARPNLFDPNLSHPGDALYRAENHDQVACNFLRLFHDGIMRLCHQIVKVMLSRG